MQDLSKILNSAATLIQQADQLDDEAAKASLRDAARTMLQLADIQLAPGTDQAPGPDPEDEDD